jgi:hypothetical protein
MILSSILIIFLGLKEIEWNKVIKLHLASFCSVDLIIFYLKQIKTLPNWYEIKQLLDQKNPGYSIKLSRNRENFNLAHAW